ncbi:MAG: DUF2911 domain-containing protein [Saprospiraceae bacterium]|nr:DUF2911 domain-containing protein [Saprospiraceae bacterium]
MAGRRLGVTDIEVRWNAPAVRGREGKIWGTEVAWYGFTPLGFGSYTPSPWRAGANECTTISFSTDVTIQGKILKAGKYAFFIALEADSCLLIFNKNVDEWGSYFYKAELDVLRVSTRQQKDLAKSRDRLEFKFLEVDDHTLELALEWEKWRIPFTVQVNLLNTTLHSIQSQLSGAMGFDPPSLQAGAAWCLRNNVNLDQALVWIQSTTDPNLGGIDHFNASSIKAGILAKLGRAEESKIIMDAAVAKANARELHGYGRQLLGEKKHEEAMKVFQTNFDKHQGEWPTHVGLMRGFSALGKIEKALDHARKALEQAPNEENRKILQDAILKLENGLAL